MPELQPPELYTRESLPSRTYALNLEKGKVSGVVDGLEAMQQFVFKALSTARWEHVIYNGDYGSEHRSIVGGSNNALLQSEMIRAVTEALIFDDRVTGVHSFSFVQGADSLLVSFTVDTTVGSLQSEVVV